MFFPAHAFANAQMSVPTSMAYGEHSRTIHMAQTLLTCGTLDQETREEPIDGMMATIMMQ
jgi:hypothetical protein